MAATSSPKQLVLALFLLVSCSSLPRSIRLLREAGTPSSGAARSIGRYDAGCIAGARTLPLEGKGFVAMRTARNRYHGHPELIAFLSELGAKAANQGLGGILVGDLGQPRGGPMISGHASHQIGLDADIWLRLAPLPLLRLAASQPDDFEAMSVLSGDTARPGVDPARFGIAQARLLQLASSDERVARIFVNPAIKLELCATTPESGRAWLRKLRPWSGHDAHFHVRLHCPRDGSSPACVEQDEPAPGDGCQEAKMLAEYFRELEAKEKLEGPSPPRPVILPEECEKVAESG